MTMLAEIQIADDTQTAYEPTVQDKIQRVLYRLDQGEELVAGSLRHGKNFCVLGLFADESGIGDWCVNLAAIVYTDTKGDDSYVDLSPALVDYYNFTGATLPFNFNKLPLELQNKIKPILNSASDYVDLVMINDRMIAEDTYTPEYTNAVLAEVIRSGVCFRDPLTPPQNARKVAIELVG